MELHLTTDTRTSSLKESFSALFPFLKLEFFHKPHQSRQGSPKHDMYRSEHKISEVGFTGPEGQLVVRPDMKISEFEKTLFEDFGLCVQVFRKSGKVWLETSATDHLSLSSQNELGMERERPFDTGPGETFDLHEQP